MSFTYAELKQAIKDYTEYSETSFVTNIPLFIRLSEERLNLVFLEKMQQPALRKIINT